MANEPQSFEATPNGEVFINNVPILMAIEFRTEHSATDEGRARVTITFDVDELDISRNTDYR